MGEHPVNLDAGRAGEDLRASIQPSSETHHESSHFGYQAQFLLLKDKRPRDSVAGQKQFLNTG